MEIPPAPPLCFGSFLAGNFQVGGIVESWQSRVATQLPRPEKSRNMKGQAHYDFQEDSRSKNMDLQNGTFYFWLFQAEGSFDEEFTEFLVEIFKEIWTFSRKIGEIWTRFSTCWNTTFSKRFMCETVQAGAAHPQNLPAFCLSDRCPTAPGDETVTLPDFIGNCRCGSQQAHVDDVRPRSWTNRPWKLTAGTPFFEGFGVWTMIFNLSIFSDFLAFHVNLPGYFSLKNDGWKTILSLWDAHFSGPVSNLRGKGVLVTSY